MTNHKTAQEIARATLDSIADLRRACEGKPKRPCPEDVFADTQNGGDVPAWLRDMMREMK